MNAREKQTISTMALRFLKWFCPDHLYEEIEGDLIQKFHRDVKEFGEARAKRRVVWNVIRFFRPGILLRNEFSIELNVIYMILHNLRFSLRHLGRQKLNTSLHVIGLTLGMSVCLLIGLFLRYELSFDGYHDNSDHIYRVNSVWTDTPQKFNLYATPFALAEVLRTTIPGLKKVALVRAHFSTVIEVGPEKRFKQERVLVVEPEFLDIFKIQIIQGDKNTALKNPYQALLTETTAKKFYGDENPVGKTFKYRNKFMITVAGVIRDLPPNTNLPASMLLSYVANDDFLDNGDAWNFGRFAWVKLAAMTYVVLADDYDPQDFQSQLTKIADANINSAQEMSKNIHGDFEIQPLKEIHFGTNDFGGGPWVPTVNMSWLWIFAGIGLVVLTLACINFLNLSTAQAITRAREVGVRKSIGAQRAQLILQFLGEAGILTIFSAVVSIGITIWALRPVNDLLGTQITFDLSPGLIGIIIIGIVITSLLAGVYPAWIISRFNPVITLKSNLSQSIGTSWLRKGLVITQFTISAALLLIVLVISRQLTFMRSKDLGFDRDNIVTVEIGKRNRAQFFANEISQIAGVKEVSITTSSPISTDHWWNGMSLTEGSEGKVVCAIYGDEHFYSLFALKLLSGRIPSLSRQQTGIKQKEQPANQVVVNEMLLKDLDLGTADEAVGKHFWWGGDTEIVGVIADFNLEPLRYEIRPTLIAQDTSLYSHLSIKLEAGEDILSTLSAIEASWKKSFPEGVYEFEFLDDEINSYYQLETKLSTLFKIFAGMAILISCLGLWGLVTFVSQQRTKEIGIRKVLGASVRIIVMLLSKDFVLMVMIAIAIASPLTYYLLNVLLQNFAYRVDIGWDVFVITGVSLFVIAMATMSFQTLKAAMTNPVNSLKSE